tara:strand:+ start:583 stop:774 length:192 start_codon:yes stop_codon:yes gene_type:complete
MKMETVSVEEAFNILIERLGSMPIQDELVDEMQLCLLGLENIKVGTVKIIGDSKRVIIKESKE